jgi:hypothetical protein
VEQGKSRLTATRSKEVARVERPPTPDAGRMARWRSSSPCPSGASSFAGTRRPPGRGRQWSMGAERGQRRSRGEAKQREGVWVIGGVFDFTPLASLADEPGCGQPEPASNHASLTFDLFSHLRQAKTSICV